MQSKHALVGLSEEVITYSSSWMILLLAIFQAFVTLQFTLLVHLCIPIAEIKFLYLFCELVKTLDILVLYIDF